MRTSLWDFSQATQRAFPSANGPSWHYVTLQIEVHCFSSFIQAYGWFVITLNSILTTLVLYSGMLLSLRKFWSSLKVTASYGGGLILHFIFISMVQSGCSRSEYLVCVLMSFSHLLSPGQIAYRSIYYHLHFSLPLADTSQFEIFFR